MKFIAKETIDRYIDELNEVRKDSNLLTNYTFEINKSNHYERLRLNIAMFNDFRQTDYPIAKYLFEQESNWRRSNNYYETGYFDNLYFSALLLSEYQQPEIVINFWKTKMIDMDSGIGFDGEYLVSNGIQNTYEYLNNLDDSIKDKVLNYIGKSKNQCNYTEERLKDWRNFKIEYFQDYILPIEDPMWFLYSVKENNQLKDNFEEWIISTRNWDENRVIRYWTFSEHLGDKENQIKSLQMILKHSNESENGSSYWAKKLRKVKHKKEE